MVETFPALACMEELSEKDESPFAIDQSGRVELRIETSARNN